MIPAPEDVSFSQPQSETQNLQPRKGSELEEAKELWKPRAVAAPGCHRGRCGELVKSTDLLEFHLLILRQGPVETRLASNSLCS